MSDKANLVDVSAPSVSDLPEEFLAESDKFALEMSKMKVQVAVAGAEKALAQNETAKAEYNNVVLQLAMKYSLTDQDVIDESGAIKRGAAQSVRAAQTK